MGSRGLLAHRSIALLVVGSLLAAAVAPAGAVGTHRDGARTNPDGVTGPDTVTVSDGVSPGETVEVREVGSDLLVTQAVADDDGTVTIDTAHLDSGQYYVEDEDNDRLTTFTVTGEDDSSDDRAAGSDGGTAGSDGGAAGSDGTDVLTVSDGVPPGETVEVREVGSDLLVAQVLADGNGTVAVTLNSLDTGTYYLEDEDNDRLTTFVVGDVVDVSEQATDDGTTVSSGGDSGTTVRSGTFPLPSRFRTLLVELLGLLGG